MRKSNKITIHGTLCDITNYEALIKAQASNIAFKSELRKQKVIKTQKIGSISRNNVKRKVLTKKDKEYNK